MLGPKSIAIFGGNGFLGRKICETGVRLGYNVTSFSRSGQPSNDVIGLPWAQQVKWEKADIFKPETYQDKLEDKSAVVHSIGLLLENPTYKKSINSNFSFLDDISQAINVIRGPNPMERNEYNTYEAVQRDSALLLADTYLKSGQDSPTLVYISADSQPPIIPKGYLSTKREAEVGLLNRPGLRSVLVRPSFMYDENANGTTKRDVLKHILDFSYLSKETIIGDKVGFLNGLIRPPVSTRQVSKALFKRVEDESFHGVVSLEEINDY